MKKLLTWMFVLALAVSMSSFTVAQGTVSVDKEKKTEKKEEQKKKETKKAAKKEKKVDIKDHGKTNQGPPPEPVPPQPPPPPPQK
jgi:hypothetical protein